MSRFDFADLLGILPLILIIGIASWMIYSDREEPAKPEPRAFQTSDAEYQLSQVRALHARWLQRVGALRGAGSSEVIIHALDMCATELDVVLLQLSPIRDLDLETP